MARYLPRDYEPIPDALLHSDADLVDVTRRIARNQNWIWANHGNVFAACGREPTTTQGPPVQWGVGSTDCAYFACPARSATGSDSVRVAGYATITGGTPDFRVRLYQLLPGETTPTADTPYDDKVFTGSATETFFEFTARIRSGGDPLRFCLRLVGATSGTITLLTVTVTWARNPTSVLGETVEAWKAISQAYVQPDRPASAALLRAISNRTLRLIAENPRPIYSHSFLWPRFPTNVTNTTWTRVGLWTLRYDDLTAATLRASVRWLVTGNSAGVSVKVTVNGTDKLTGTTLGPTSTVDGVYVTELSTTMASPLSIPSGDVKVEAYFRCNSGATSPPTYCTNVGAVLLGLTAWQSTRTASDLGLPGGDTVPAAYQPLDDDACAPGRSLVAQDDRLGRRAGPYYLVKNLIWLAANRTAHVLVADWLHSTQSAALAGTGTGAGDGYYRNETLWQLEAVPTLWFWPMQLDRVPWADRAGPTNYRSIANAGHHFKGDVVGRWYCRPMNGGKISMILRPDVLYAPAANGQVLGTSASCDLFPYYDATPDTYWSARPGQVVGGFQSQGPLARRPTAGQVLTLRAMTPDRSRWLANGMQLALNAAYIYEAPLTQNDLEALA